MVKGTCRITEHQLITEIDLGSVFLHNGRRLRVEIDNKSTEPLTDVVITSIMNKVTPEYIKKYTIIHDKNETLLDVNELDFVGSELNKDSNDIMIKKGMVEQTNRISNLFSNQLLNSSEVVVDANIKSVVNLLYYRLPVTIHVKTNADGYFVVITRLYNETATFKLNKHFRSQVKAHLGLISKDKKEQLIQSNVISDKMIASVR
jgi:hypothetical protein